MPVIKVQSLPFHPPLQLSEIVVSISYSVSQAIDIDVEHVMCSWSFFESDGFAVSGTTTPVQTKSTHPIVVDLILPNTHSKETVSIIMSTIAGQIAESTAVERDNIFITAQFVESKMVFENGQIIQW
ncbi:hypothetical protein [Vibrio marisflavi]|uniref:Uncharacterized protein n=1 Tax=Vibrio marisflavi CECT 7928 TaxID=634439 RepID=A0ABN8E3E2_9VIBR|nr:hypothetical protein [Vibrio marisflavi]CAH0536366.1 hypothetical protein VMF7928_00379 [Vibrio marisflavi CECT 7928]